ADHYGIWDKQAPGGAVQRFPATDQGRLEGWERYRKLEPGAEETDFRPATPPWVDTWNVRRSGRRKWVVLGAFAAVMVALAVFLATKSNGGGGTQNSIKAAVGSKAHMDISGGVTGTDDLTGQTFQSSGFDSLYPRVDATWKGATAELHIRLTAPRVGTTTTGPSP